MQPPDADVDIQTDHRINFAFRAIFDAGFNSGRTYKISFRTLKQKNSLLQRLVSLTNAGLIPSDGGLISNLTVEENILLPVQYHAKTSNKLALQNATTLLMRFDLNLHEIHRLLQDFPANLSVFEKRLTSFVRILAVEPEILVCETVFEGLTESEIPKIRRFEEIYHLYFPFRTVIFLELDHTHGIIQPDQTFNLQ